MKGIKLPIIVHTEQSAELSKLEIESSMDNLDTKNATFYRINGISNIWENGKEYGVVYANGTEFFTPLSYKELERIVENGEKDI